MIFVCETEQTRIISVRRKEKRGGEGRGRRMKGNHNLSLQRIFNIIYEYIHILILSLLLLQNTSVSWYTPWLSFNFYVLHPVYLLLLFVLMARSLAREVWGKKEQTTRYTRNFIIIICCCLAIVIAVYSGHWPFSTSLFGIKIAHAARIKSTTK